MALNGTPALPNGTEMAPFLPFVTVESSMHFCSMALSVATLFKDDLCHSSTRQYIIFQHPFLLKMPTPNLPFP